jgi:type I restriction enzyme S subunit
LPFSEAVLVNPPTLLEHGKAYPFVEMSAVTTGMRDVRSSEQRQFSGYGSRFRNRDTLMARITPCLENGKVARFQAPESQSLGHGSTEFIIIRGRPGVSDNDFAYYLTISPKVRHFAISQMTGSSGRQRVPTDAFNAISIPLPPVEDQKAIASVLGALDDKIELNRRTNETLEALAQALFKSWFVDVTANGLPKGWREKPLSDAIEVNPARSLRKGEVAPYLDMANIPTSSARALEITDREFGSGMRFRDGDTLVARITPCLENGKTCFVDSLGEGRIGWGSTEYIVLRPKPPLPPEFAYFLARTDQFRAFAISNMTGTTGRQRVPADCLSNFTMAVPPTELAAEFGKFANAVFEKMKGNDEESRTLAALRDTLLPKLLSGELRIQTSSFEGAQI